MDPVTQSVVDKTVGLIIDPVFGFVKRHFGYLISYKKRIQELEAEIGKLRDERERIQRRVDRATENAEVIEDDVSKWLKEVETMEADVTKFLADKVKENKMCFKCWCPDFSWPHRLGKGAQEKKEAVTRLKDEGGKFEMLPVAHPAPYPTELQLTSTGDYMIFDSRNSVFNAIMEALKDSRSYSIGVHGPGGVGKTKMVEEIAKKAKEGGLFHEIVLAVVSKDADIRKIQEQLASRLNLTYIRDSEDGRAGQLWQRLKKGNKTILVILDDVWGKLDCKKIGIPISDGDNCKILLTTRSKEVCDKMDVQKEFSIGVLLESEAWTLFMKVVGNVAVSKSKAEEVCNECGGLPVAIIAIAAALKGKPGYAWDDALVQLKNSSLQDIEGIDSKIYTSLKYSYDKLEKEDAKSCFLLCCLFPEDAEISVDDLVRYCVALRLLPNADTLAAARNRVRVLVDSLKSSYLLLHGRDPNFAKMHDVIRDVAISISKGNPKSQVYDGDQRHWSDQQRFLVKHGVQNWPEKGTWEFCTAISLRLEDFSTIPAYEFQCPELHTLLLGRGGFYREQLPDWFFKGMKKVVVLDLTCIRASPLPSYLADLAKLKMLSLNVCWLEDIAIIKNVKSSLEILKLGDGHIKNLPPEIRELTRLRLLDLEDCYNLEVIPEGVITNLSNLEELYIPQSFDQWEASTAANTGRCNASLAEIKSLKQLSTLHIHIPDAMLLPKDIRFENLNRFHISVGERFGYGQRSLEMRILKLSGTPLKKELNVLVEKAEVIYLDEVQGLKKVFHARDGEGFLDLKYLQVSQCDDMDYLHGIYTSGSFRKLTDLIIDWCGFKYLISPSCARGLQQLQRLEIRNCKFMEGIIGSDEQEITDKINFNQLKYMELKNLPKLKSFYPRMEKTTTEGNPSTTAQYLFNEKVAFPVLENLSIEEIPNPGLNVKEYQSDEILVFLRLTTLSIKQCDNLRNVFSHSIARNLVHLEEICIERCPEMDVIVSKKGEEEEEDNNDFILFPQLRSLKLGELQNLESFCISKSEAQQIFNYQVAFPKLEELHLNNCATLRDIHLWQIPAGGGERSLRKLRVENWDQVSTVVSVPHLMQCTKEIGKLFLKNCNGVRQVFDLEGLNVGEGQHVFSCPQVKVLVLKNLPQLTYLWNKDPHVILGPGNLKFLYINRCSLVRNLFTPSVAMALEQLIGLYVKSCETMEEVVAVTNKEGEEEVTGEIVFPKLMLLGLRNLPNLKSFCSSAKYTINLPSLEAVCLLKCPKMQTFTSGQVSSKPRIRVLSDYDKKGVRISDLNKYMEQRFIEGDEEDFEKIDSNDDTDSDTDNEDGKEVGELLSDDVDSFGKDSSDEDGDPSDKD